MTDRSVATGVGNRFSDLLEDKLLNSMRLNIKRFIRLRSIVKFMNRVRCYWSEYIYIYIVFAPLKMFFI